MNTVVFPDSRRFKGYAHPEAFVDRANRYVLPLDHDIQGGLRWLDPFIDWLKQGLVAIEPHLLNLDVVGAVGAALDHHNVGERPKLILVDCIIGRGSLARHRSCGLLARSGQFRQAPSDSHIETLNLT